MQEASQGQFDGVLAASHTPERAQHLRYPSDARGETDESKRMFLVGYALLRHKRGQAVWDGMRFSGTQAQPGRALGAERGYSVVQFARERGAHMEERSNLASLLASVRLGRLQGALLSQEHATRLLAEPEWSEYEMVGPTVASKAYYLPVSARLAEQDPHWAAALSGSLRQAIAQVRRSPEFASEFSLALSAGQRRDLKP